MGGETSRTIAENVGKYLNLIFTNYVFSSLPFRRVHISQATLNCLNDAYEVEPGNGGSRDNHLNKLNVTTYLIKRTEPLR